jgi:hypothetical protein
MRTLLLNACALIGVLTVAACSGPVGPIAGGALDGEVKPWPQDWSFATDCENVLLQTNSTDPYSVTLWGVSANEHFYIASGDQQSQWVVNLQSDPKILLSIEGNLYAGVATLVTDPEESQQVLEQYSLKYDFYLDEGERAEGVIYRLTQTSE